MSHSSHTPLKLTFKIGGQTLAETSVVKSTIGHSSTTLSNDDNDDNDDQFDDSLEYQTDANLEMDDRKADEEEIWLDALEEGRLHEVDDELRKLCDPKLRTARQRALLESKSLEKKEMALKQITTQTNDRKTIISEEMIERKLLKDRKRRQQAEEKKEKDKTQTIERLLRKKQEAAKAKKRKKTEVPKITYKNSQNGIFICLPQGIPFEFVGTSNVATSEALTAVKCGREGCDNIKKYC